MSNLTVLVGDDRYQAAKSLTDVDLVYVNPEIDVRHDGWEKWLAALPSDRNVVIITNSVLLLNFLDDDVAVKSVWFCHEGKKSRVFDTPAMREKLTVMGPGEAFCDTTYDGMVEDMKP